MANRDRLLKTLIELIRIDSPTGEEDEMDREVSSRLEALGFKVTTTPLITSSPSCPEKASPCSSPLTWTR